MLATRVCPEGELSKVYMSKLESDGIFRTVASFGYSRESNIHDYKIGLTRAVPMSDAYLRSEVIFFNKPEMPIRYPDFKTLDERSPWESVAITPTWSGGFVFVFRLQVPLQMTRSTHYYFKAISNILSFYKKDVSQVTLPQSISNLVTSATKPSRNDDIRNRPLTKRQRAILALIQEGLTNSQISNEIGYSESLVRQETVLIYSKLGIRGRVDLRADESLIEVSR